VRAALSQVGKAYRFAAAGPDAYDCSGLTMWAWSQAGVSLPHYSKAQYDSVTHVPLSAIQPGDLVFFYGDIHHVGIYIGGGQMVDAANPALGVRVAGIGGAIGAARPG
jgi:cell wall-associated NlpC family hydrolase